ncbi:prefoldin subunit alpha [Candidatus Pacearchaeota archaeon]|nr:prefoldin subunit alpha [Candidatus Pacearchaeota archaeon]
MDQQYMMQFQMLQEEAQQLNQQMQMIEQNISEIGEIKESLDEIGKSEKQEILANLGKKIFLPVVVKEKHLIVDVGNKKFVKKTIPETNTLITQQLEKLNIARMQITERLEALQKEAETIMHGIQDKKVEDENKTSGKSKGKKDDECDDPNCGHKH